MRQTATSLKPATFSVVTAVQQYVANRQPLIVIPNMGNAGDALINHALYSTLKQNNIPFAVQEAAFLSNVSRDHTYLIMVNGTLHGPTNPMDEIITRITLAGGDMVLFSATITQRNRLLQSLQKTTTVICREPVSYEYVRDVRPDLTVVLSEDATMAIADGHATMPFPPIRRKIVMRLRALAKTIKLGYPLSFGLAPLAFCARPIHCQNLSAFRCDNERIGMAIPENNIDLSLVVSVRRQTPEWTEACAALFLQIIKSKQHIQTDRLHIAIGCGLTGTNCRFLPNNYYKCQAIYDHSLKKRFAHIKWAQDYKGSVMF